MDGLLRMYEGGSLSRRELVRALALAALGVPLTRPVRAGAAPAGGLASSASASGAQAPMRVVTLNHVTCFVPDVERSVAFYQGLFGMPVVSEQATGTNLSAGSDTQFLGLYSTGGEPRVDHICFGVEDFDVERIMEILTSRGIEANVRMREGTVPEIYFSDPDGIRIQLQDPSYCGGSGELGNVCP